MNLPDPQSEENHFMSNNTHSEEDLDNYRRGRSIAGAGAILGIILILVGVVVLPLCCPVEIQLDTYLWAIPGGALLLISTVIGLRRDAQVRAAEERAEHTTPEDDTHITP
jgi:hypothetical protein